jgi:hypothetical protein
VVGCEKCICKSDTSMTWNNQITKRGNRNGVSRNNRVRVPIPQYGCDKKKSKSRFTLRIVGIVSTVWHVHYPSIKLRSTRYCTSVMILKLD